MRMSTPSIRAAVRGPVVIDSVQIEDITFSTQYEVGRRSAHAGDRQATLGRRKRTSRSASSMPMRPPMQVKSGRGRQGASDTGPGRRRSRCDQSPGRRFARQSRPADTCRRREMEWCAAHHDGAGQRIAVCEPHQIAALIPTSPARNSPAIRSHRSQSPLRVTGEVANWQSHSPERLQEMKDNLRRLKEEGILVIE